MNEPVVENSQPTKPGVYLLCLNHTSEHPDGPPGHLFERLGVETAEEAIIEWLNGPSPEQAQAGYAGPVLSRYQWLIDAISFSRTDNTLVMAVDQWEPIDETSTSANAQLFLTTLFGTAFSDPTVQHFTLQIMGDTCPPIGETDLCYPISREEFSPSLAIP